MKSIYTPRQIIAHRKAYRETTLDNIKKIITSPILEDALDIATIANPLLGTATKAAIRKFKRAFIPIKRIAKRHKTPWKLRKYTNYRKYRKYRGKYNRSYTRYKRGGRYTKRYNKNFN